MFQKTPTTVDIDMLLKLSETDDVFINPTKQKPMKVSVSNVVENKSEIVKPVQNINTEDSSVNEIIWL